MYTLSILALFGAWIGREFKSVMKMALDEPSEVLDAEELKPCA